MKSKIKYCLGCTALLLIYLLSRRSYFNEKNSGSIFGVKKYNFTKNSFKTFFNNYFINADSEITLIIRFTRDTSKYISRTINSFLFEYRFLKIIIVSEALIPREIERKWSKNNRVINIPLKIDLLNFNADRTVVNYVSTKYVLIVPAGVSAIPFFELHKFIQALNESQSPLIGVPALERNLKCLSLKLNLIQWLIQYTFQSDFSQCDSIQGSHGILMHRKTLGKIGEPFMLPFPEAFYIQTTSLNMKVNISHNLTLKRRKIYNENDALKKLSTQLMLKKFKIKKVIREDGLIEWYGCTRNTQRCFPDVVNLVPEYLNQGRWTPPCCLNVLKKTVHHVFKILKAYNVTFWLEGGSLLGAMRMNDIIPWDYDVDIGVYLEDIDKCPWLKEIHHKKIKKKKLPSVVDEEGFVWEKADEEEGDFYRVQASVHNRLHVDIFPFFPVDGMMTKKTWFADHIQDMPFSESYLKPLTTIEFAGIEAPAPNNIKEFLELKFGAGCVENPQYPNPNLFPFPNDSKLINETYKLSMSGN